MTLFDTIVFFARGSFDMARVEVASRLHPESAQALAQLSASIKETIGQFDRAVRAEQRADRLAQLAAEGQDAIRVLEKIRAAYLSFGEAERAYFSRSEKRGSNEACVAMKKAEIELFEALSVLNNMEKHHG